MDGMDKYGRYGDSTFRARARFYYSYFTIKIFKNFGQGHGKDCPHSVHTCPYRPYFLMV
jgi:hypothetical protein